MQLKKEVKFIFAALFISLIFVLSLFFVVKAGSLSPSGPIGSTMKSLQEVYDVIAGTFDSNTFTGSGPDDMTPGGTFTGASALNYRVQIDAAGTSDTFTWSDDGGVNWDAAGVAITGSAQTLSSGVTVTFGATTGHTLGDRWDFSTNSLPSINGNIVQQLKYISGMTLQQIYNNSGAAPTITDSSAGAILTIEQTGAGNIIDLRNGSGSLFSISSAGLISGASGQIKAAAGDTFYTAGGHPIRKAGEQILRSSAPIYRYSMPSQTTPAALAFIRISKYFADTADISLPSAMDGTTRVYRLVINYADDIAVAGSTSWRIINGAGTTIYDTFTLPGRNMNMAVAPEGLSYLTDVVVVPSADWQIEAEVPIGKTIRIFSIFLEAYDQVN
ncbi:MAG: hypothetical protein WA063_05965 [Minisyncoccia bacterium]